jgi:hypothetical protein
LAKGKATHLLSLVHETIVKKELHYTADRGLEG